MLLQLDIPDFYATVLLDKARAAGKSVDAYFVDLLEGSISDWDRLDLVLAPVRQDFRESGMTEEELDVLIEECREEVYQMRKGVAS